MQERLSAVVAFLTEIEKLKLVYRKAYVSDLSRHENSAEHSWHLAIGLLTIAHELDVKIDIHKALVMALIHDLCEIDAGDTPVFGPARADQHAAEFQCIDRLASYGLVFGPSMRELWLEYEQQQSLESRWVKVLDRLMPFFVNLATQGKTWLDQSVCKSQVLKVNEPVKLQAPEIYEWMLKQIDGCIQRGWLLSGREHR